MRSSLRAVSAVVEAFALHLVLALQAFRCQLVDPRKNERRHESQHEPGEQQLVAPRREVEQAEQQVADLQQDPGCDEVQRRHSQNVAALQLRDDGHARPPSSPSRSPYYVSVRKRE